jgi:7-carboxy-7-deazaguanine synthase
MTSLPLAPIPPKANQPTLPISEIFGPTFQGEGLDTGRPCFFLRTQLCPVQCPGCDTHYTWDGSEAGEVMPVGTIMERILSLWRIHPGCGLVVSGGEPLMHYRNHAFYAMLQQLRSALPWISLETSGFIQRTMIQQASMIDDLQNFLYCFDTISCSPKVTPCLHGRWTDVEQLCNIPLLMGKHGNHTRMIFKFVARDEEDIQAILKADAALAIQARGYQIQLMPYGIERDEVIAGCEAMLPYSAKYGWTLSPRLHALLWGKKRGV